MHLQILLPVVLVSAVLALISFVSSLVLFAKTRRLLRGCATLESRFEEELADLSRDLDTASRQSADWGRKIAWLESRVRGGHQEARVTETAATATTNGKLNITERRHRVLSLARRGQDAQTISRTLGMPHGEVELMINLGHAA